MSSCTHTHNSLDSIFRNAGYFEIISLHRWKFSAARSYDRAGLRFFTFISALATKIRRSLRPPLLISETIEGSGTQLSQSAKALGLEGIIAKRLDSLYEPGRRSGAWVKYKINKGQEFVIGGYTPGNPFDAVIVGYYGGDKLLFASKVRAGFVPHLRRELMAKMKPLRIDACPIR